VNREATCAITFIDREKVASVRSRLLPDDIILTLAEMFRVLGDPTRVRIINALSLEELCVCDIASLLGTTRSAISHQLRLLRTLRVVRFRRAGKIVYYTLDDSHIGNLFREGLNHIRSMETKG
jgi:ArsR family transcriptional regulator, lead/cadmium/zinc/bismuth-responsive transcriptional repressor